MGVIHVLEKNVAELIAAGEVVERPASAAKELMENAIDAGATAITVEIKNGGITFLRVTDNGCGFYKEDVRNAFLRHATSKVKNAEDLDAILTMGFRGEALASLAAVAKVELLSRRADEVEGVHYTICASQEESLETAGCSVGTTVIVRDLFFNTPARLKFLKKDTSEANAVANIVEKMALSYPEIAFRFLKDGEEKLNTPGDGKLLSTIYSVFGRDFAAGLMPVDYSLNGLAITGFISKPHAARSTRSMQNFYVNRRYVKSKTCVAALEEGYKHALMVGKFPACILSVQIPANAVDVNVHPAKIEIRFENERPVFDLVYFAVKSALLAGDPMIEGTIPKTVIPAIQKTPQERMDVQEFRALFGESSNKSDQNPQLFSSTYGKIEVPQQGAFEKGRTTALSDDSNRWIHFDAHSKTAATQNSRTAYTAYSWQQTSGLDVEVEEAFLPRKKEDTPAVSTGCVDSEMIAENLPGEKAQQTLEAVGSYDHLSYIGELFRTYILFEGESRLVLVDKHAAHERILYNRLKSGQAQQFQQNLLSPVTVLLGKEEYSEAIAHLTLLQECGFEAEDFGRGSLLVRSVPMWLDSAQIEQTIGEICEYLAQGKKDVSPEHLDWIYHNVACRSAVKGGDKSTPEELQEILRLMKEDGTVFHCPHGRPVAIALTQKELEKQFGRI